MNTRTIIILASGKRHTFTENVDPDLSMLPEPDKAWVERQGEDRIWTLAEEETNALRRRLGWSPLASSFVDN